MPPTSKTAIEPNETPVKGTMLALRQRLRSRRVISAIISNAILTGITLWVFYLVFFSKKSDFTLEQLTTHIGIKEIALTSLTYAIFMIPVTFCWGWIMGTLSGVWNWPQHLRIYCVTGFTRRLPGTVWYLLGRVVMYEQLGVARATTVIASGLEFGTTIMGGLLVCVVSWPIVFTGQGGRSSLMWLVAGLIVCAALLNPPVLRALIRRISKQQPFELRYRDLFGWTLVYAFIWCCGGAILFILINALQPLSLALLPAMIGIWSTAGLIAFVLSYLPIGLGVPDLTLIALLTPYLGVNQASIVALLMRVILTSNEGLWALATGILGLLWKKVRTSAK